MPSTDTITAFTIFAPRTLIESAKHNQNFGNFRGHIIPIEPSAASAHAGMSYGLGSATYRWGDSYFKSAYIGSTTLAWQIQSNTTTGDVLQFMRNGAEVARINTSGFVITASRDLAVSTKTADYTLTSSDGYILADGSTAAFNIDLSGISGTTGRPFQIEKSDSTFNQITIMNGASTLTTINTQGEVLTAIRDGTNWRFTRYIKSEWVDGGVIGITATTTAPTKGSTLVVDKFWYRRCGDSLEGRFEYRQTGTTGAATGTGDYLFAAVPTGLTIDTAKITAYATAEGTGTYVNSNEVGHCSAWGTTVNGAGFVSVYNSTHVRMFMISQSSEGCVGGQFFAITNSNVYYTARFTVPITNWKG